MKYGSTFSGTYMHFSEDGRKTLCGRRIEGNASDTTVEEVESIIDSLGGFSDGFYCSRCLNKFYKLVESSDQL